MNYMTQNTNFQYLIIKSPERETILTRNCSTKRISLVFKRLDDEQSCSKFIFKPEEDDEFFFDQLKYPFSMVTEIPEIRARVKLSSEEYETGFTFASIYYAELFTNFTKNPGPNHPLTKELDKLNDYMSENLYYSYSYTYKYKYKYKYGYDNKNRDDNDSKES
jgi:hypothetical protein